MIFPKICVNAVGKVTNPSQANHDTTVSLAIWFVKVDCIDYFINLCPK